METLNLNSEKIQRLNAFMSTLKQDMSREAKRDLYEAYKDVLLDVRPIDLFYVEMYKQDTKESMQAIKKTANKFVNVFLKGLKCPKKAHDHPFFQAMRGEKRLLDWS